MGLLSTLMMMEDRKTQREIEKRTLEFKEKYEAPYMEAMTGYQNALKDKMASDILDDSDRQLRANQALLTKEQAKNQRLVNQQFRAGLSSSDPNEVTATRNAILGLKQADNLDGFVKMMGLKIDQDNYFLNALKTKSDLQAQELGKYQFLFGALGNKEINKFLTAQQKLDVEKYLTELSFGFNTGSLGTPSKGLLGGWKSPTGGTGIGQALGDPNQPSSSVPAIDPNTQATLEALRR